MLPLWTECLPMPRTMGAVHMCAFSQQNKQMGEERGTEKVNTLFKVPSCFSLWFHSVLTSRTVPIKSQNSSMIGEIFLWKRILNSILAFVDHATACKFSALPLLR